MNSVSTGIEWVVDASGCDPARLRDVAALRRVFDRVVIDLELHSANDPQWRNFPPPGGVTGLLMLTESHLCCHSFPERGYVAFNLYCCRERQAWDWEAGLRELLGATSVVVRALKRG
jgi:S-adenosylmethionine decarboxylase